MVSKQRTALTTRSRVTGMLYGRSDVFPRLSPFRLSTISIFRLYRLILSLLGQRPIRLNVIVRRSHVPRLHLSYRHSTSTHLLYSPTRSTNPRGLTARLESGCARAHLITRTAYCNVSSLGRLSLLRTIDTPLATFTMWSLSDLYSLACFSFARAFYIHFVLVGGVAWAIFTRYLVGDGQGLASGAMIQVGSL